MICDCCGSRDENIPRVRWLMNAFLPRPPLLLNLVAICGDCASMCTRAALRPSDVADLVQLCWSIDMARV